MFMLRCTVTALSVSLLHAPCAAHSPINVTSPHASVVDGFMVTTGDISDRHYVELGKVTATASTVNWANPLGTDIDAKLRAKARKMGADAVVRVRFSGAPSGNVG